MSPVEGVGELDLHPVTPRIGAEIRGLRLSGKPDSATADALRRALRKYKVLFLRNQGHIDQNEHQEFAQVFGPVLLHPAYGTGLSVIDCAKSYARVSTWHADITFQLAYPGATVLQGVVVPSCGGDTLFANSVTAYDELPAEVKRLADTLRAIHSNQGEFIAYRPDADSEEIKRFGRQFQKIECTTEHPVVRVISETGERSLLLGQHFRHFVGMSREDSRGLYQVLQGHVTAPQNTMRWRWQAGDIAIWENRTTQHYAVDDYGTQARIMHSVVVGGDVPVGIDGRPSRSLTDSQTGVAAA